MRLERYQSQSVSWEVPCGGPEEDETPLQAAQREFREEAQKEAKLWTPLWHQVENAGRGNSMTQTFLAADIEDVPNMAEDPGETILDREWFTRSQITELIAEGEIHTAHTLGSILMADTFFRQNPEHPITQIAVQ